jgi:hypothetical protein
MSARRIPVFFYGLFMDAELLRAKGTAPGGIQQASVPGFALRIGQRATLIADAEVGQRRSSLDERTVRMSRHSVSI